MNLEIILIQKKDKKILENLMQLYLYDFSQFNDSDLNKKGVFEYKYLPLYWEQEDRKPFLIKSDGKICGFVLVHLNDPESKLPNVHTITEFFILKKYRRINVGTEVAIEIFNKFKGKWIVRQLKKNIEAQIFWKNVIEKYTNGSFSLHSDKEHIWEEFCNLKFQL